MAVPLSESSLSMEARAAGKLLGDLSSQRDYVRLRGLFLIVKYLGADYRIQFAEKNFATLLYACLKCMQEGLSEEIVLATRALSLLSMTIGPGDQADELYKEALPLIHKSLSSRDEPLLISAINLLAVCAYVSPDFFVKEAALMRIWHLILSVEGVHVLSAAIVAWSFVLASTNPYLPHWTARFTCILWSLMENPDESVQTAADDSYDVLLEKGSFKGTQMVYDAQAALSPEKGTASLGKRPPDEGSSSGGERKKPKKEGDKGSDDENDNEGGGDGGDGGGGGEDPPELPASPDSYQIMKPIYNKNVRFTPDEASELFKAGRLNDAARFPMTYHTPNQPDQVYDQMCVKREFHFARGTDNKILYYYMNGQWDQFLTDVNILDEEYVEVTFDRQDDRLSFEITQRDPADGGAREAGGDAAAGGAGEAAGGDAAAGGAGEAGGAGDEEAA